MRLYAPSYYKEFKCMAGECPHTCCAGWEIDVDPETAERYMDMGGYLKESLSEDGDSFVLTEGERCPHLEENGLCRIISEHGEGLLCQICREHPRFYTYAPDRAEMGVGMSCYAAAKLILSSDYTVISVGQRRGEKSEGLDTVSVREFIFSVISDKELTYENRLKKLCDRLGTDFFTIGQSFFNEIFASIEYLDPRSRELFGCFDPRPETDSELEGMLERALAYFVFRHCTEAVDGGDYRARLGFCLLCERLLCSLMTEYPDADPVLLAVRVSEELEYSESNTEAATDAFFELFDGE